MCVVLCLAAACAGLHAAPVAGVLTSPDGKPVSGVNVYSFLMSGSEGKPCEPKTEASTSTAPDGSYSLGELSALTDQQYRYLVGHLPGKFIGLAMQCPRMAEMERYWGKPQPLTVVPVAEKKGRVVNEQGRAQAGVPVKYLGSIRQGYPMFLPSEILKILHIPTDLVSGKDGSYTITDVASDAEALVAPRKKGFAARNTGIDPATLKIVLVPAGRIEGKVVDSAGKPLAGVGVSAFQENYCNNSATTNASGRYVLPDLSPGKWRVGAQTQGQAFKGVAVEVKANKTTQAPAISALPMTLVTGRVVYAENGKPVEGVSVDMGRTANYTSAEDLHPTTDASGSFRVVSPSGQSFIELSNLPAGYVADKEMQPITVPKTGLSGLTIKLIKALNGKGRVIDTAGQPVADAGVSLFLKGLDMARTDAAGSFTLTLSSVAQALSREFGHDYMEAVWATQTARNLAGVQPARREDLLNGSVVITVGPIGKTRAHVVFPSGKPASGVRVGKTTHLGSDGWSSTFGDPSPDKMTDANGYAMVDDLVIGAEYDITASLPGYYSPGNRKRIVPAVGAPKIVEIRLEQANRVQKGKVIDEKGRPVPGVEVSVQGEGMRSLASAKTDAAGRFTLRGLPDARVRLSANKGRQYGSMNVSKSTGSVILQIVSQEY